MPTRRLSVRRLSISTAAALALTTFAAMRSAAAASPASPNPSKPMTPGAWSDPRMEAQAPLVAAADRIQALAATPGWGGFAGVGWIMPPARSSSSQRETRPRPSIPPRRASESR